MQQSNVNTDIAGMPHNQAPKYGQPEHAADGARWYILRCGGGLEFRAAEALRDAGWAAFLPVERKWRPSLFRHRRPIEIEYPRFPRYLFVRVSPPLWPPFGRWPLSAYIRGVLSMNGRPTALGPGEIERLKAEDGVTVLPATSRPLHKAFQPGVEVRVKAGPFRDFTGALDAVDGKGAHITVQLFGRPAEVALPLSWLEAA